MATVAYGLFMSFCLIDFDPPKSTKNLSAGVQIIFIFTIIGAQKVLGTSEQKKGEKN